jgi:peptidyl-prolyl cis-trans isomerase D
MLKVLRDNLKYLSWILWLVIAVFILFAFVDFGGIVPGPAPPTEAAAVVDGDEITYGELQRAYRQTEEAYRQAYGAQFTPELAQQLQLPLQVLEQLVQRRILLDEAERMGLAVSDAELQKELLGLTMFQNASGQFVGGEQYRSIVRQFGYANPEEFEEGMRSDMLLAKLNQVLSDNVVVSDQEVEEAYRRDAEKAKIRFVRVPLADFRDESTAPADEVEAYFQANLEEFRLPERRAVDYLLVDPEVVRQGIEIGDDELAAYYQANSSDYAVEEQVRARQILLRVDDERSAEQARSELEAIKQRIEAGEDFATLASELSEDQFTAAQGGEMAPFGRGQILPEVETAAFDAEVGGIVGPVASASSYSLLEILDHTPGGLPPFEEMKDAVRRRLEAERAREAAEAKAGELAERLAREEIASAQAFEQLAAEDAAVSFRTTEPFGLTDNVPAIGRSTPFSQAAFELEENGVSAPVRMGSGWAILRLAAIEEPRLPELGEVDGEVRARLRDARAEEAARQRLQAARERIAGGSSFESVASDLGIEVEESSEFNENGVISGALGANRSVARAALALEAGEVGGPVMTGSEAVLFRVEERRHFDPAEFEQAKDAKRQQIASQRLDDLLGSLLTERREEIEITYDPRMSENLGLAG